MTLFALEDYRADPLDVPQYNPKKQPPPRHQKGEAFLKGPIPMSWLLAAARLPGRALHVGMLIWFQSGRQRRGDITFSTTWCARQLGTHRNTAARALRGLEGARLVQVKWGTGKAPRVVLLDTPINPEGSAR